jgi:hypothetical protein
MSPRFYAQFCASILAALAAVALLFVAPAPVTGQAPKTVAKATKSWTVPRTIDGQPDFQGYWTNATVTPLERPVELGTKEFFTEAEAAAYAKQRNDREINQAATDIHYDNVLWQSEHYAKGVSNRRTSLIFDPPDGRIPPLSANGLKLAALQKEAARRRESPDSVQSRSLAERCITWGNEGPPMLGSTYNANLHIMQNREAVYIGHEIGHAIRIIPVDGRAHLAPGIRQMGGDSRGRWDGDTLVVDSTNFSERTNFRGPPAFARQDIFSDENLHVVEKLKRIDAETIVYQFTVEDPSVWTKPWSGELIMRRMEGPLYEYACHEGNYGLANILAGARAAEKAQAAKK